MPATPIAEVDAAIERLHAKKDEWLAVPIAERIRLLERIMADALAVAPEWAAAGARIKGLAPDEVAAGEEWLAGPMPTIRNARLLANALRANGAPRATIRTRSDGRAVARVFPANAMERVMFTGVTADVWIARGERPTQGAVYRADGKKKEGVVCLVLGGGNVSSIPPMDALYKLFVEDEVVLLKMNPVNEALGPVLAKALGALVDGGWLAIVYGGADVGGHAANHPKVGSLHVTGSDRTYDAIVWGGGEGKKRGERANTKPFSAELGCVTPVIVVPGPWSDRDIRFQARHVASMVAQNASFNCNAAKVIVTARGWLQRDAFLAAVRSELAKLPPRKAYYPGARDRYRTFLEGYPKAHVLGGVPADAPDEVVPWTVIPDVPAEAGEYALTHEAFCGVLAEVTLDAEKQGHTDVPLFLERAVAFANEKCWGTLSCCLLVHPATEEEHDDAVKQAIADLRYGGVGVNVWPGAIYGLVSPSWGAYPGHTPEDIQSGTGVVHNTFLFDHPEKSVLRAPFRIRPTPAWFVDNRNLLEIGRRLVAFEAAPSWRGLIGVATAALRG
jgi:acyl-CoA reductase-like NAD-dependent aldehyde dehydrogenase